MNPAIARIVMIFIVGAIPYLGYTSYVWRVNSNLRLSTEKEFDSLNLPAEGSHVYQETSGNRRCSKSRITFVYTSKLSTDEICEAIASSIQKDKWKFTRRCETGERPASGTAPSFRYMVLEAERRSANENYLGLSGGIYPNESSHPYFFPISEYRAGEVVDLAKQTGNSLYYVSLWSPMSDAAKSKYQCYDGVPECECFYSTFFKSKFADGRENEWSR